MLQHVPRKSGKYMTGHS